MVKGFSPPLSVEKLVRAERPCLGGGVTDKGRCRGCPSPASLASRPAVGSDRVSVRTSQQHSYTQTFIYQHGRKVN